MDVCAVAVTLITSALVVPVLIEHNLERQNTIDCILITD
jgi:hypothetical protein